MDFILGIFTGISIAILWGMYLNKQREKKEKEDHARSLENVKKVWTAFRLTPEDLQFLNSSPPNYPLNKAHAECLKQALQDAIERDDFEEAARLRDLMNKRGNPPPPAGLPPTQIIG